MKVNFEKDGYHMNYWKKLPEDVQRLMATDSVERALKVARPWASPPKPWLIELFNKCRQAQIHNKPPPKFEAGDFNTKYSLAEAVLCLSDSTSGEKENPLIVPMIVGDVLKHGFFILNKKTHIHPSPIRSFAAVMLAELAIYSDWTRGKVPTKVERQIQDKKFSDWFLFRSKWILEAKENISPRFYHLIPEGKLEPPSGLDLLGNGHPKLFDY